MAYKPNKARFCRLDRLPQMLGGVDLGGSATRRRELNLDGDRVRAQRVEAYRVYVEAHPGRPIPHAAVLRELHAADPGPLALPVATCRACHRRLKVQIEGGLCSKCRKLSDAALAEALAAA